MTRLLLNRFASLASLTSLLLAVACCAVAQRASAQDVQLSPAAPARIAAPKAALAGRQVRGHADALDPVSQKPPQLIALQNLPKLANVPAVQVGIEPLEGGAIVYHRLAGKTFYDSESAQVSLLLAIKNQAGKTLQLDKVRLEYAGGSKELPATDMSVANGATLWWQNGRDYHAVGELLYLPAPIPNSLTIKLYFAGYSQPATVTKPLKPYARAFALPFKDANLRANEVWEGGSTHGGGSQVFAYDLGVHGYDKGWTGLLPGKDDKKNENYRVWGKPIYAMADGVVADALNDCPNNPKPAQSEADMDAQKANYWGSYSFGGSGNHLYIQHGDVIALYAHLQKGSIPVALRTKSAVVKKGDLLGYAGNSGNSWAPHLHVHLRKETVPETGPFRPLMWSEGFAIYKTSYASPKSNVAWSKLSAHAIPGFDDDRSYIWPSTKHPYCNYATGGGEISRHGVSAASFQEEFDKIWTCGYYPTWIDGYSVGSKTYFNLVVRPDDGKPWVARHDLSGAAYQTEFDKWAQAGYRLTFVDSYLKGGTAHYAAVWRKDGGAQIAAYHGVTSAKHQAKFDEWTKSGWVPVNVSLVGSGGEAHVTALYEKASPGGFYARHAMTPAEYQTYFDQYGGEGFKLVYVNGYSVGGKPMLSAIWYKKTSFGGYIAKHALTAAQYQTQYTTQLGAGFVTRSVTGYDSGGSARFAGLWTK